MDPYHRLATNADFQLPRMSAVVLNVRHLQKLVNNHLVKDKRRESKRQPQHGLKLCGLADVACQFHSRAIVTFLLAKPAIIPRQLTYYGVFVDSHNVVMWVA